MNNKLILGMLLDIRDMLESDTTNSEYIKAVKQYVELATITLQAYERKEKK